MGRDRLRPELHTLYRLIRCHLAAHRCSQSRSSNRSLLALVVFIGLNLLQFVIGSYIEPRVAGTAVSVSPFMVLFAVFFWGMLWGIAGAFIGVPILIALATVCARHPAARPLAVLLSAGDGAVWIIR